jgi:hypothetical protein
MKNIYLTLLVLTCSILQVSAQHEIYYRVRFNADKTTLEKAASSGVVFDHLHRERDGSAVAEISGEELSMLKSAGVQVQIEISDLATWYRERNQHTKSNKAGSAGCSDPLPALPSHFHLGSMGGYYTYTELLQILDSMALEYPDIITVKTNINTFQSVQGRPLYYLKMSDNPNATENEPRVLFASMIHAREPLALMQNICFMWYMLENYSTNDEIKYLIDNLEIYFVPMVNPDGYVYNVNTNPNGGGMWRKNRRSNPNGSTGVDLNRNFGFMWGYDNIGSSNTQSSDTYRGPSAFSEPETQALKWLCEQNNFLIALNHHAFANDLIYPWGYIAGLFTPDSALFVEYATLMTEANGFNFGTGDQTVGYVTNGDSDDWMYGEQTTKNKILSMTPETGSDTDGFWPAAADIPDRCRKNLLMNLFSPRLALKYPKFTDLSGKNLTQLSSYIPFSVKRFGLQPGSFTVSFAAVSNNIQSVGAPAALGNLALLETKTDSIQIFLQPGTTQGSEVKIAVGVDVGGYVYRDTLIKYYGTPSDIYYSDGTSVNGWQAVAGWGVTTQQFYSPSSSITDSPTGNYTSNTDRRITLTGLTIPAGQLKPALSFFAKWNVEAEYDYVQVSASSDGGSSWTPLCGKYTKPGTVNQDEGQPIYDGIQNEWVEEYMSLEGFPAGALQIRFRLVSDGQVNADGYYFDELRVTGFTDDTGVEAVETKTEVWPNPTTSEVNIYTAAGIRRITLSDISGRTLFSRQTNGGTQEVQNLAGLNSGLYMLRIETTSGQTITRRLLIKQ